MSIATRLDRLHLLFDCSRSAAVDRDNCKSFVRLLGVQNGRLFTVASESNAKAALRLALRNMIS